MLLLAATLVLCCLQEAEAAPASVWTVGVWPAYSNWSLDSFIAEGESFVVGPTGKRWRISRAGLEEQVADDDVQWDQGVGYRGDRQVGRNDTVVGGRYQIGDMLDPAKPPITEDHEGPLQIAGDVDGDGTVDLIVLKDDLLLHTALDGVATSAVPPQVLGTYGRMGYPFPVADVDLDGHAELFDSNPDAFVSAPQTSTLVLHDGGPDGYAPLARWRLTEEGGSVHAVAVQADTDEELELVVLMADLYTGYPYSNDLDNGRLLLIDDAHTEQPTVWRAGGTIPTLVWGIGGSARMPFLHNVGDLDGDGGDEVIVMMWDRDWNGQPVDLQIVSSARGYDLDAPLASFNIGPDVPYAGTRQARAHVADLDLDGHLDLVAVQSEVTPTIQVWFGPLYEPPPEPTGLTGDTGAPPDTGSTTGPATATATTPTSSTTADTGVASSAAPSAEPPASSCGCASRPTGSLWLPWGAAALVGLRRRTRRRSPRQAMRPGSMSQPRRPPSVRPQRG